MRIQTVYKDSGITVMLLLILMKLILIIGANDVGKTNLLYAILIIT